MVSRCLTFSARKGRSIDNYVQFRLDASEKSHNRGEEYPAKVYVIAKGMAWFIHDGKSVLKNYTSETKGSKAFWQSDAGLKEKKKFKASVKQQILDECGDSEIYGLIRKIYETRKEEWDGYVKNNAPKKR